MMGIRRYLTSRYDWTGISRLFYTSKLFELISILIVAALVGFGFYLFHGPIVTEILDVILLIVLSLLLLSNAWRMVETVMKDNEIQYQTPVQGSSLWTFFGIPAGVYIREAKEFILQFVTQKRLYSGLSICS